MKIKVDHKLVGEGSGNGHHGYCKHCGVPLVTDLGYSSWEGVECVEIEITDESDIPEKIRYYARFRGFFWNKHTLKYHKSYSEEEYDLEEMQEIVDILSSAYHAIQSEHQNDSI